MSTKYVVVQDTGDNSFTVVASNVEASSAASAIRQHADGTSGRYAAVPSRSWNFLAVKVETVKRVRVG